MRIVTSRFISTVAAAAGLALACAGTAARAAAPERYQNFNSAIFVAIDEMRRMAADPKYMQDTFDLIHSSI